MYFSEGTNQKGLIPDYVRIFNKYGLLEYLTDFADSGNFLTKGAWTKLVRFKVHDQEEHLWSTRMSNDPDFTRFRKIHPRLEAYKLFRTVIERPEIKREVLFISGLVVKLRHKSDTELCHICGHMYADPAVHITLSCIRTIDIRDSFWCFIVNHISDITFSV